MPQRTDLFSLERLKLRSGEGRRIEETVPAARLAYGGSDYAVSPDPVPVVLDVSRTTHSGFALRLRFAVGLAGPCMRCLAAAAPTVAVDVREVSMGRAGDVGEELASPYVDEAADLDLARWAGDALVLAVPDQILCRPDCLGLCPVCGIDRNTAGPDHGHEREPDPRWAKLRELKLD